MEIEDCSKDYSACTLYEVVNNATLPERMLIKLQIFLSKNLEHKNIRVLCLKSFSNLPLNSLCLRDDLIEKVIMLELQESSSFKVLTPVVLTKLNEDGLNFIKVEVL